MDSHTFWLALDADLAEVARTLRPVRVTIGAVSNGLATVQTGEMTSGPTDESYARILSGVQINPGDDAWALYLDPGYLILGKNQNSAQSQVTFELPISAPNGVSSFSGGLVGEVIIDNVSADASETASTTAISTFQPANTHSFWLPAGTWNVWASGWLALKNSAGNNGQLRLEIDGNPGGTRSVAINASTFQTCQVHTNLANVAGGRTITILLEYHGTTSGTTSAQNPALLIVAQRAGGPGSGTGGATLTNPMTTQDDLIVGGASGTPTRLGKGSNGQVLTVDPATGHLVWATPATGFADPTTTKGDLIVRGATTTRLGVGSDGQVLTADSTQAAGVKWATAGGSADGTPRLGWTSGRYLIHPYEHAGFGSFTGVALTALRLYAGPPIFFHQANAVTELGIFVNSAAASGKIVRLGFYNVGADGIPTTPALDAGTVTVDAAGARSITGLSWTPTANTWYVPVIISDSTPTILKAPVASLFYPMFYGTNTITNVNPGRNHSVYNDVATAAFSNPFAVTGYLETDGGPAVIWIKQS